MTHDTDIQEIGSLLAELKRHGTKYQLRIDCDGKRLHWLFASCTLLANPTAQMMQAIREARPPPAG